MNYSHEEIINALKIIKDICSGQIDCIDCPFHRGEGCYCECIISVESPNGWTLNSPKDIWKALV